MPLDKIISKTKTLPEIKDDQHLFENCGKCGVRSPGILFLIFNKIQKIQENTSILENLTKTLKKILINSGIF